ncbi:MAG TPA: FHA domain-containing protein [Methanospirillum sp.]|nr:FHA domain-containing protein [Methanospirillum sp.]
MVLEKICDVCGMANPATEMICQRCFSDISGKKPVEKQPVRQPERPGVIKKPPVRKIEKLDLDNDRTIRELKPLILIMSPGKMITVHHGDSVGRDSVGGKILHEYSTVSRHHATFKYFNGKWLVKDENSTNGTYVGGRKVTPDMWYELKNGDTIAFSHNCKFIIET